MPTSQDLIRSLRDQPLLIVLRPGEPLAALEVLQRLEGLGVRHVEIAWQPQAGWTTQMAELIKRLPGLRLGAASVCLPKGVEAAAAAGCRYVVSPVLDPALIRRARELDVALVPGVLSPSEVHSARQQGCDIVKLFPAVTVGPGHWRRLREPLGQPLPFCIAAGGLTPKDVLPWLAAGVDAVALGSALGELPAEDWRALLSQLSDTSAQPPNVEASQHLPAGMGQG